MRSKDFEVIDRAVKRRGITIAELSRRIEMDPCCFIESLYGARNVVLSSWPCAQNSTSASRTSKAACPRR